MPTAGEAPVRHLWLLRHGKAASDAPWGGSDRERPLTGRGRRDAAALGSELAAEDPLGLSGIPRPQLAVCSAAVRTRQTADLVAKGMGGRIPVDSYRSLYAAGSDLLLRYVRDLDGWVLSALVVGHNPGIYELAWLLLANRDEAGPGSDRVILEDYGFPTCALAVVTLGVARWSDVGPERGHLSGLFKPPYRPRE